MSTAGATPDVLIKHGDSLCAVLKDAFAGHTMSAALIPMIVMRSMAVARDYTGLTGAQKEQLVTLAVTRSIAELGIGDSEKALLDALLPALLPALIQTNFLIDQTAQAMFKKAKDTCGAFGCFKASA
jgi:hypothetical protein